VDRPAVNAGNLADQPSQPMSVSCKSLPILLAWATGAISPVSHGRDARGRAGHPRDGGEPSWQGVRRRSGIRAAASALAAPAGYLPLDFFKALAGGGAAHISKARGAGGMNVSSSASCAALGITRLVRVPVLETPPATASHAHGRGAPWPRGHYPWPTCPNSSLTGAGVAAVGAHTAAPTPRPPLTVRT